MRWKNTGRRERRATAPGAFIDPCLPTKVDKPPIGDQWAHEIKHDGFRLQVHTGPAVRLYTMTGVDCTMTGTGRFAAVRYPAIVDAAELIRVPAIIDAEAVIVTPDGIPDFKAMESRQRDGEAFAYAFDLLMLDGEDLRPRPWLERRKLLKRLLGRRQLGIRYNDHHIGDGSAVYAAACRMGLEGIVSKKIDSPYRSGKSRAWLKCKNPEASGMTRFK